MILHDEEEKLGAISFESAEPLIVGDEGRDLLQILINQATVAMRNALALPAGSAGRLLETAPREAAKARGDPEAQASHVESPLRRSSWSRSWCSPGTSGWPERRASCPAVEWRSPRRCRGDRLGATSRGRFRQGGEVVATLHDEDYRAERRPGARGPRYRPQTRSREASRPGTWRRSRRHPRVSTRRAFATPWRRETSPRPRFAPRPRDVLITPHLEGAGRPDGRQRGRTRRSRRYPVRGRRGVAVREVDANLLRPGQNVAVQAQFLSVEGLPREDRERLAGRPGRGGRSFRHRRCRARQHRRRHPSRDARKGKISTGTRRLGYAVLRNPRAGSGQALVPDAVSVSSARPFSPRRRAARLPKRWRSARRHGQRGAAGATQGPHHPEPRPDGRVEMGREESRNADALHLYGRGMGPGLPLRRQPRALRDPATPTTPPTRET